jgi:hypothetical protein
MTSQGMDMATCLDNNRILLLENNDKFDFIIEREQEMILPKSESGMENPLE